MEKVKLYSAVIAGHFQQAEKHENYSLNSIDSQNIHTFKEIGNAVLLIDFA